MPLYVSKFPPPPDTLNSQCFQNIKILSGTASSSEQVFSQQTSQKQISPSRRGFIAFVSVALFSTVLFGASVTLTHPAAAQTTPLTALSSTGCTDGTYVNTTNDPRVAGDNNDLVEDCLAIVAIQNSWATSANAGLTSGAALRNWGTGLIATWSGLTVETVSGANRVTELESVGRRRGRFLNTQITGVLPADIGKLTALTKISLPGKPSELYSNRDNEPDFALRTESLPEPHNGHHSFRHWQYDRFDRSQLGQQSDDRLYSFRHRQPYQPY